MQSVFDFTQHLVAIENDLISLAKPRLVRVDQNGGHHIFSDALEDPEGDERHDQCQGDRDQVNAAFIFGVLPQLDNVVLAEEIVELIEDVLKKANGDIAYGLQHFGPTPISLQCSI